MRILQVIDSLGRGGAERVVVALATGQARAHEVRLACLYEEVDLAEELHAAGVPVHVLGVRPRRNLVEAAWKLSVLARSWAPNAVHAHLLDATLAVGLAQWGPARLLTTFHNLGVAGGVRGGVRTRIARSALALLCNRRFDVLTAVSQASAGAYARELGLDSPPLVLNNPLDLLTLRQVAPVTRAAARELTSSGEGPLVVCVAKLTWEKSHRTLLDAVARLPTELRPHVVMVGDGPLRAELEAHARQLRLEAWVNWLGALDSKRVYAWVRAADLCVLSSVSEGQPVSVLESMALETPVLATSVGGVPGLLADGRGWLVPASEPQALSQALFDALANPSERERRAQAARRYVESAFSLEAILPRWEALLR